MKMKLKTKPKMRDMDLDAFIAAEERKLGIMSSDQPPIKLGTKKKNEK